MTVIDDPLKGMPRPPIFESVDEERRHRKLHLAAAYRIFAELGLNSGVAGHISARDPEQLDHIWVNPWGLHFSEIKASDLCLVSSTGELVEGPGPINPAAYEIHWQALSARPELVSAAHSHSPYGRAWSSTGRPLEPITQDSLVFYKDHVVIPYEGFSSGNGEEGERLANRLGSCKAAILQNHGLLTVGHSIDEALGWYILLEECCRTQLLAESVGTPTQLDRDLVEQMAALVTPLHGWFFTQPLLNRMLARNPELAE